MRAARILTVMAALLSLGSCEVFQFLFGSVFPGTIALAKARADLSGKISANDGTAFRLRVVQSGGNGYVVVVGSTAAGGLTAYVYDPDLAPKATLTGLTGDGVMVDGGGYVVVGSQEYDPVTFSPVGPLIPTTLSSNGNACGTDGFYQAGPPVTQVANIYVPYGTNTLNWGTAGYPWSGLAAAPAVTLSASHTSLALDAVLDDGDPLGNITLAVSETNNGSKSSGETCYFVTTPKTSFTTGPFPTYLLDSSPHLDNIDTGSIGFAQGSIMVYDSSAGRFLRVDPATGSTQSSFYSGSDVSSTRIGYLASGGFFYGFDTKTRVLTKYAQWW